jgi:hypothetical protein
MPGIALAPKKQQGVLVEMAKLSCRKYWLIQLQKTELNALLTMISASWRLMNFGDAMIGDQKNVRRGQLDRVAQSRIGRRLRLVYRHLVGEPIPDDHIDLLLALRWKEREQGVSASKASGAPKA